MSIDLGYIEGNLLVGRRLCESRRRNSSQQGPETNSKTSFLTLTRCHDTTDTTESDDQSGSERTLAVSENVVLAVGDNSGNVALHMWI